MRILALSALAATMLACSIVSDFDGLTGRFCDRHRDARICLDFDGDSDAGALPAELTLDRERYSSPPASARFAVSALSGDGGYCNYARIARSFTTTKRVVTVELDVRVGDTAGAPLEDLYFVQIDRGCNILYGGNGVKSVLEVQKSSGTFSTTRTTKLGAWSHVKVVYEAGAAPAFAITVDGAPAVARAPLDAACGGSEVVLSFGFFCYNRNEGANEVRLDNILVTESD